MDAASTAPQKAHRVSRKSKSTSSKKKHAVAKPAAFARRLRLSADRSERRAANPARPTDRSGGDAAPRVVAVVGPSGVGKSTVIRNLVHHYSRRRIAAVTGPITIVAGRRKRITFLEVAPDLPSMIDAAKVADLVLLLIDASFGFEMETFEFLNIAAAHGMPKVMGVLTHLDNLRDGKQLRHAKKTFKDRLWSELYPGAKVFYLSGITTTGDYLNREILNLARFISVTKFANLTWRTEHPYLLADRVEDITPATAPPNANRTVAAYGYVRGTPVRLAAGDWRVHLAGVGDLVAANVDVLPDPCPPPEIDAALQEERSEVTKRKRRVSERERLIYAPMAPEIDGISYDRDAVYINLASDQVRFSDKAALVADGNGEAGDLDVDLDSSSDGEGEIMVKGLQKTLEAAVDDSLKRSELRLVKGGKRIISENFKDGRRRRRVVFDSGMGEDDRQDSDESDSDRSDVDGDSENDRDDSGSEVGSEDDADGDTEDEIADKTESGAVKSWRADGEVQEIVGPRDGSDQGSDSSDADEIQEDGEEAAARRWKDKMLDIATMRLRMEASPSKALAQYIYGKDALKRNQENREDDTSTGAASGSESEEGDGDTFFRLRNRRASGGPGNEASPLPNAILDDITRLCPGEAKNWASDEILCARLKRRRFGTGQRASQNGNADRIDGDDDSDGTADGDFEDLETGEVHRAKSGKGSNVIEEDGLDDDSDIEAIRARKIRQKEEFNAEWDRKGERDGDRDEDENSEDQFRRRDQQPDTTSRKAMRDAAERAPDPRKVEQDRLAKLRIEEMRGLDAETRMALEGILPGRYVRLELQDIPVEFVKYFDPKLPVVIGGLKPSDDEGKTFVRARIRRHRFKRGVLKSSDPVVFSIGWRRFQSVPLYDTEDQGGRRRFLKYTPEYLHCNATFWAPSVAPGAGVIMCQSLGRDRAGFRIAGTGVVTELGSSFKVVKKLKLVGEPIKVYKNTAFIKGMFNSELEVSKYVGASLRTVSGIRGTIKKTISERSQRGALDRDIAKSPAGTFRAGFEDKILLSDVVFLRAWVPVEAPRFCSIATTLLDKERTGNGTWRMRTIREVRQAKGLPIPLNKDSLYAPIERTAPVLAPLKIPKKLEGALPYASKPKNFSAKKHTKPESKRKAALISERAVVLDPKEKQEQRLLQAVYTIRNDRAKKRKEANEKRLARRKKELDREEEKRAKFASERRKRKFAVEGTQDSKETKRLRTKGGE